MKKYVQQIITAILTISAFAGIALAQSFDISTLTEGFVRAVYGIHNQDDPGPGARHHTFYYGYGWSGFNQEWGYGYGYSDKSEDGVEITANAPYGFDGEEGPADFILISSTATTITMDYSTDYLAIDLACIDNACTDDDGLFDSGVRSHTFEGLTCGTQYDLDIRTIDAGGNHWITGTQKYSTQSCSGHHQAAISGSINKSGEAPAQGLRLPPITLLLGSVGQDVQDLQILLNYIGVYLDSHGAGSPGEETQYFGQKTYAAVKAFQQVFNLKKVDGIYGIETYGAMESFLR